jgi:hypothetical protein
MAPAKRSFPTRSAATEWVKSEQKGRQMKLDPTISGGTGFTYICGKLVKKGKLVSGKKCKCKYRFSKKKGSAEVVLEEAVPSHGGCVNVGVPSIQELASRSESQSLVSVCVCLCLYGSQSRGALVSSYREGK